MTENIEPNTTSCPAKSASPSICFAILNDETAGGDPKIASKIAKLVPLRSNIIARGKKITGANTNFPSNPIHKFLKLPRTLENVNDAPKITSANGVVTFDKSLIVFSIADGNLMPIAKNNRPSSDR